jgi:hypothetical protein
MPKIVRWDTPEKAKRELAKRLHNSISQRRQIERNWETSERTLQNTRGVNAYSPDTSLSFESEAEMGMGGIEGSQSNTGINYTFKNLRFIHSQLSANPPTVVARPTSNDHGDRKKADTADRLIRYAIRQYKMQEKFDTLTLNCLYYGTAFIKTMWDPTLGEIIETNTETGEVLTDGDISITIPTPWNIFVDPDANTWDEVKFVIERMYVPWEEALFAFGEEKEELLEKYRYNEVQEGDTSQERGTNSALYSRKYDVVELYQYWEKGLPYNGMKGRFCWMLKDGTPLSEVRDNPHSFNPPSGDDGVVLPARATLPYTMMTDLDVPNSAWGKATVDYEIPLQETHNRMMDVMLQNLEAHGVARIILPEGAEVSDDSITNSPLDIIKVTGGNGQQPNYMEPMPFPTAFDTMFQRVEQGINDSAGVNDAMFGEMKRETSGFSLQYATNQGNMIRRRMFNKYVLTVETVYKTFLNLVRKYWDAPRQIAVLGEEKAFNVFEVQSTDISGGFDLVVEYGASLSLDPTTRREEILTMMPLFEKAGVSTRSILGMLKLNELEGLYDRVSMANDRQYEVFKEMTITGEYITPDELQDHKNMLEFAYEYVMTSEFKYLDEDSKELIKQHILEREQIAAQGAAPQPGAEGGAGALAPPTAGMTGAPADVTQLGALLGGAQ